MLLDARDLPEGAVLEADVCIVGSGPVAIGLALGLDGTGLRIVMLEAGGADPAADPVPDGAGAGVALAVRLADPLRGRLHGLSAVPATAVRDPAMTG